MSDSSGLCEVVFSGSGSLYHEARIGAASTLCGRPIDPARGARSGVGLTNLPPEGARWEGDWCRRCPAMARAGVAAGIYLVRG